jgi:hypothetical protein
MNTDVVIEHEINGQEFFRSADVPLYEDEMPFEEEELVQEELVQEELPQSHHATLMLNGTSSVVSLPVEEIKKRSKGRPCIHGFSSRAYLLKKEIETAMSDQASFIALMQKTYELSNERKEMLGSILDTPNELSFTVHGKIQDVLEQLHKIRTIYGENKVKINISKERLLNPKHALYVAPIKELIGEKNGKPVYKHIFEEFNASKIYGYATVTL